MDFYALFLLNVSLELSWDSIASIICVYWLFWNSAYTHTYIDSLRVVWVYSTFSIAMNLLSFCWHMFTVISSLLFMNSILFKQNWSSFHPISNEWKSNFKSETLFGCSPLMDINYLIIYSMVCFDFINSIQRYWNSPGKMIAQQKIFIFRSTFAVWF